MCQSSARGAGLGCGDTAGHQDVRDDPAAAAVLWAVGGWTAIATAGIVLSLLALAGWAVGRRGALVVAG